jgi:hypothetical protein
MSKRAEFTYGRLDKVLRSLGFSYRLKKGEPPARIYEHKESGAIVILPAFPKRDRVLNYHFVGVRKVLDEFGIADPATLTSELQSAV